MRPLSGVPAIPRFDKSVPRPKERILKGLVEGERAGRVGWKGSSLVFGSQSTPCAMRQGLIWGFPYLGLLVCAAWFVDMAKAIVLNPTESSFDNNYQVIWANNLVTVANGGSTVDIALEQTSGSGFASKGSYLYGHVSIKLKLVPGNSAGVVTAYYMSSQGDTRSELDFEFLGNKSGQPYQLQTNIYGEGVGGREQRVVLWFDPSAKYHTYSFLWNDHQVVFYVDTVPVRVLRKTDVTASMYPNKPMQVFSSIWDASNWATRGGLDKIDWTQAPFVASYRKFALDACRFEAPYPACASNLQSYWWGSEASWSLTHQEKKKYNHVHQNLLVYDYCTDTSRYPTTPAECLVSPW